MVEVPFTGNRDTTGTQLLVLITAIALTPLAAISIRLINHGLETGANSLIATGILLTIFIVTVVLVLVGLKLWNPGI